MRCSRFSVDQIVGILDELNAGAAPAELCRQYEISEPTLYRWKRKYAGFGSDGAQRLQDLQDENARLKRALGAQVQDNAVLRELLLKNF